MFARLRTIILFLAVAALAGDTRASALVDDASTTSPLDTVYTAPEIIIEAPRVRVKDPDILDRPGFVAVLDLSKRRHRVEDLAGALSQLTGIRVRQYGGLGSFATTSIRGSSSNQVEVFLDGIPLNDGYTGMTNLADFPIGGAQRIEVYRGFAPPNLGASSIGGVINLVTAAENRGAGGKPHIETQQSYGSFDTSRHALSLSHGSKIAHLFVHGGYVRSDGDFSFVNDRSTPFNRDDDEAATRRNNAYEAWNIIARGHARIPATGTLSLSHYATVRDQGVPGIGASESNDARSERDQHVSNIQFRTRTILDGRVFAVGNVFYSTVHDQFQDPNGDISLAAQDTDNRLRSYGGNVRTRLALPRLPITAQVFHQSRQETFSPSTSLPKPSAGPDRNRRGHSTTVTADLVSERIPVVFTAGERFESYRTEFFDPPVFPWLPPSPQGTTERHTHSPFYGVRWHATPFITLKSNWGRQVRQPTMLELFGNTGSITGNEKLENEEALNRDVGLIISKPQLLGARDLFLEVAYLDNKIEQLIALHPVGPTMQPRNISSARVKGWEFSWSALVAERLRIAGNYTRLDTKDNGQIPFRNGNELPGRLNNDLALSVDVVDRWWNVRYEFHHMGANFLDPANLRAVPKRDIHNLIVQIKPFAAPVSLTVETQNFTDNQISDVGGFPLPGRAVFATVNFQP